MTKPAIEHRVDRLEDLMAALMRASERTELQVERTERQVERTERQAERTSFELAAFKDEMRTDRKQARREWGELTNRLGTMAEDLVAPSIPRILRTVLDAGDAPFQSAVRVRRHSATDPSVRREFDVVAVCGGYLLVNETKSRLAPEDVNEFLEVLPTVRDYFPEHADKRVIGAIGSLYVDESVVRFGEAQGLIVLGFGEDVMDVLNSSGFVPREF